MQDTELGCRRTGRLEVERAVRPVAVAVVNEGPEHALEVAAVDHQQPVRRDEERSRARARQQHDLIGLGAIAERMLSDPEAQEWMVKAPTRIFRDTGERLERVSDLVFTDDRQVRAFLDPAGWASAGRCSTVGSMRERLPLFAGLALLAIAFVVGSSAIAGGIRNRNRDDVIVVTGSAKKRIVSDYVVWNLSVSSRQTSASEAAKELAGWTSTIRSFLGHEGVEPGEVTVQPISTATVARSGRVVAYRLSRRFEVRSARVQEVTDVADRSSALLTQGIPLAAQSPQYVYTKLPTLRPQLLAEATKDAQNRARVIVEATGAKLGKLRGVDVGVFQVTTPNSTQVEDYGVYDTGTLEKDVTAVVNVTFALK